MKIGEDHCGVDHQIVRYFASKLKFLLSVIVSVFHSKNSLFLKVDMSFNKHWDH